MMNKSRSSVFGGVLAALVLLGFSAYPVDAREVTAAPGQAVLGAPDSVLDKSSRDTRRMIPLIFLHRGW